MKRSLRSEIQPFHVMEVFKAAAERHRVMGDVLHLEVGQPSTPAPRAAREAALAAIEGDRLGYTDALGIFSLRTAIADRYRALHDLTIDPGRVAVTVGASGGFLLALLACFDVGDRVGMTEPGYAAYRNMLGALGLEPVGIRVGPEGRYVPSVDDIEAVGSLDGLVVASPSNPTGTAWTEAELTAVAAHCDAKGIRLISDEIYHGIGYEGPFPTAAALSSDAIVVQSFSKYYSMTGWRVGWMIVPPDLARTVERLAQNLFICAPAISQVAAEAALGATEELDANVARYREGRAIVLDGLHRAGIPHTAPADGAFYVWADVSHLTVDSAVLCRQWLDDLGVAVTPGIDFDPVAGARFIRLSYSEAPDDLADAMNRIAAWRDRHQ